MQQSFTDYEIIIVDDCSNDSTPSIISSYKDKRIKYFRNKVNLGQTPSLNIALNLAKGKYIARIDADDIYLPGKLEKQYNFMEQHPSIAVSGTFAIKIDENGKTVGTYKVPIKPEDIYFNIFFSSPLVHVGVAMRRSIILENGGYNEQYPYCADFALWSKLIINNYQIANLPESLIKFRIYDDSLGAVNKLGLSGQEATDIIYSNISELLHIPVSRKECKDIVLMLWPSSGASINDLSNAYLNLIAIAKNVYSPKIPLRTVIDLNKYYLKSFVKRGFYFKSQNKIVLFSKELLNVLRINYKNPILIFIAIMSFIIVLFFSKKNINKLKLVFSV